MRKFNINNKIYVQITYIGWEHLKKTHGLEYINIVVGRGAVTIENKLWYELQGHEVINLFGGVVSHKSPIGIEIMFNNNDLK